MIEIDMKDTYLTSDFFSKKVTLILEDEENVTRKSVMNFITSLENNKYYGMVGRENNMIPFLSILDNLLLGISKKQKSIFLNELSDLLDQFKLASLDLNEAAKSLSKNEQLVLQMIRALILKQTIIIFDSESTTDDSNEFLIHLMPILKRIVQKREATLIVSSKNKNLANSLYYDQCFLFNYLSKKND